MEMDRRNFVKGAAMMGTAAAIMGAGASAALAADGSASGSASSSASSASASASAASSAASTASASASVSASASTSASASVSASSAVPAEVPAWLGEAPVIDEADVTNTIECEILVVGAGTAGYFAALAGAEAGAKVCFIEKLPIGNAIRSSALGALNSKLQQEQGCQVDAVDMINDLARYSAGNVDEHLLRLWADNSGEAIDWYTDYCTANGFEVQLEWNTPDDTRYVDYPTGHGTNGEYPAREADVATSMDSYFAGFDGCQQLFSTSMTELIKEDGKVVGIYAEDENGDTIRINASKGVIICTGGYAANEDMYMALQGNLAKAFAGTGFFPSCTGDGIKACLWAGAQMDDVTTSLVFTRGAVKPDFELGDPFANGEGYDYFFFASQPWLRVDKNGVRIHNESEPYDYVIHASLKHPGHAFYPIWDASWKENVQRFHTMGCSTICYREGADHDAWPTMMDDWIEPEMESFVEDGTIQKADSLEELASKLQITDVDTFLATVDRQNENYDLEHDYDFGKEAFRLSEIRTAPFYGVKMGGFALCTLDGIKINTSFQALDANFDPIEGLYVVGNDSGNFYGGTYYNLAAGINAGRCATFGRMCAQQLAAM